MSDCTCSEFNSSVGTIYCYMLLCKRQLLKLKKAVEDKISRFLHEEGLWGTIFWWQEIETMC